jgi:glycogen debranching enzyme
MSLAPGEERELAMTVAANEREAGAPDSRAGDPGASAEALERWPRRAEAIWLDRLAHVRASNSLFERVLQRALLDLHLLRSRLDGHDYFAAGIPWFVTLFGRDAAIVGLQTLGYGSDMARQTLRLLARYQATEVDDYRDAAPGKILHELRRGELARLGAIPQSPAYYGTVDATMLFLILAAEYVNWSGDLGLARQLRPNLDAALRWMASEADAAGGYLQYTGRYAAGGERGSADPHPVACSPQAWAAGALPYALWSLLGFRPDALRERLHIRRPLLPEWLEWVEIEGLQVGDARVDVRFEHGAAADRGIAVKWAVQEGELDVAHTASGPPPGTFE